MSQTTTENNKKDGNKNDQKTAETATKKPGLGSNAGILAFRPRGVARRSKVKVDLFSKKEG